MHKEKVLEMSHEFIFYQEHKRNIFLGKFLWMLIFENTSNANLLDAFCRYLIESI
jgi:hypothetical protein